MDISQKALRKTFALAALGLYAFGLGATVGARSYEYVRTIGDYKINKVYNVRPVIIDNPSSVLVDGYISFAQPDISATSVRANVTNTESVSITPLFVTVDESPFVYGYHVFIGSYFIDDTGYININTTQGDIPLKFTFHENYNPIFYTYDFNLQYANDGAIVSNLYLDNFAFVDDDDDEVIFAKLPTIFFNGNTDIMNGLLQFDRSSAISSNTFIDFAFDVKIIPPSMVDFVSAYNQGKSEGYAIGYEDGKLYVLDNSNDFNLYTYTEYLAYGQSRYNQGLNDGQNTLSMSGVMETIFTAPIKMFMQIFNSSAWRWTMPTGEVLDLGGLMTFFLTIGIALAIVRLIMKVGGK